MGKPDFMVVGGVKCGTTSLYYYLQAHPQICTPCKESYLFTPCLNRETKSSKKRYSESEYRELFDESATEKTLASGEVSSIYLYCYEEVIPEIKRILGDIKIIMVLRNPIDRAYSHYSYFARDIRDERTFEEAVQEEIRGKKLLRPLQYVGMGLYSSQVKAYLDNFSLVKVILFDELVQGTENVLADIYNFIGVDASHVTDTGKVYNASGMPKCRWLQHLLFKPTPFKMKLREIIVRHIIPEEKFVRFIETARQKNLRKVPISDETRYSLFNYYQSDIEKLETLLDRDLTSWKVR